MLLHVSKHSTSAQALWQTQRKSACSGAAELGQILFGSPPARAPAHVVQPLLPDELLLLLLALPLLLALLLLLPPVGLPLADGLPEPPPGGT